MTRSASARTAGFTFLLYIAAVLGNAVLLGRAAQGQGIVAQLASIGQHATEVRIAVVLGLLTGFAALVLGVTLYAITREQDAELALLALICRVCEGVLIGLFIPGVLGRLWLATSGIGASDSEATQLVGAFLMQAGTWNPSAIFFAVGSTLFSWLLLQGRIVPAALGWLGVLASALLAVGQPLQLAGVIGAVDAALLVLPVLVFEVMLALWLLIKGVASPVLTQPA